jgi:hypothetical protein
MISAAQLNTKTRFLHFIRLGTDFDPKGHRNNVKNWRPLEAFKNRAPMKNWFQIPYSNKLRWGKLAKEALKVLTDELSSPKLKSIF